MPPMPKKTVPISGLSSKAFALSCAMFLPRASTYARSLIFSAFTAFCSTKSTATPDSLICLMRCNTSSTIMGAKPAVGSSSSSIDGLVMRARAKASIWRCPPDRCPAGLFHLSSSIGNSSRMACICESALLFKVNAPICIFS